jgi:uncharacterized NAD-dependent epimerase/dehydratase family protein
MRGVQHALPSIADVIDLTIRCGKLTNPAIRCVGIAVNTQALSEVDARAYLQKTGKEYRLHCVDPVRFGVGAIVDQMALEFPQNALRLSA